MIATFYWPETGQIAKCLDLSEDQVVAYTSQGLAVAYERASRWEHYYPGGVKTDLPLLTAETGTAPFDVDCSGAGGPVTFKNEVGDETVENGGVMTLLDAGEYTIIPPFPYKEQKLVLS